MTAIGGDFNGAVGESDAQLILVHRPASTAAFSCAPAGCNRDAIRNY